MAKIKVDPLARNTEALFKLLGGNREDRLQFWEILKGITTPAVQRIVNTQIEAAAAQLDAVQKTVKALQVNVKDLSRG